MSLIRRKNAHGLVDDELMTLQEAAARLRLSEAAIRLKKAGTQDLTLIRQGEGKRRPIFLLRSEVEAHLRQLIERARAQRERPTRLVYGEVLAQRQATTGEKGGT